MIFGGVVAFFPAKMLAKSYRNQLISTSFECLQPYLYNNI
ncbi:hypothetical protein ADIWIN_2369 [Winogradskyella psychrotolerans RS-3]|uniref:Uncharacterized protein n=1 Tax=Winogradskyella psychrotolerans RS-3 TaxID=641526 RepID=S7VQX5_9FLAO|nr:hypothetical protein ADIWIN_2369 [Winogradskyella psychrotolerans RS-3]